MDFFLQIEIGNRLVVERSNSKLYVHVDTLKGGYVIERLEYLISD